MKRISIRREGIPLQRQFGVVIERDGKASTSLPCPNFPAAIRRRGHWTRSPNAFAKRSNYASK